MAVQLGRDGHLHAGGARRSNVALLAAGPLPPQRADKALHTLDALDAQDSHHAERARGPRRRHLHDHLGVLRLHVALPRHEARDLAVKVLLLGAELHSGKRGGGGCQWQRSGVPGSTTGNACVGQTAQAWLHSAPWMDNAPS